MQSQGESSRSKRQKIEEPTSILDLGENILLGILSKIANESKEDIQNIYLISMDFGKLANNKFVWNNLSLDEVPFIPDFHEVYAKRFFKFMKLCQNNRNPEAIYKKGVINYFHSASQEKQQQKGLDQMRQAAEDKNEQARFVIGLVLLCLGGKNYEEELDLLSPFLKGEMLFLSTIQRKLEILHRKVQNAWGLWGRESGKQLKSTYTKRLCNCDGRTWSPHYGWARNHPDGDLAVEEACPICIWDNELFKLINYL